MINGNRQNNQNGQMCRQRNKIKIISILHKMEITKLCPFNELLRVNNITKNAAGRGITRST